MARIFLTHSTETFDTYYGDRALAALQQHGEVVRNTTASPLADPAALAAAAAGCSIIVAHRAAPAPAALFPLCPDLRAFCRVAVDISTIDVPAATKAGVLVTQATPGFVTAVAELAIGFMIDLARGISGGVAGFHAGAQPKPPQGRQLEGATLGIIGYGAIGRRLAVLGRALGMTVLVTDPHAVAEDFQQVSLDALLPAADFTICLAIAIPETAGLMNAAAFARMKRGSFFINLSRGSLVDEAALAAALDSGHLAGAAIDVGSAPDQMPPLFLATRSDVLATPHIGGLTLEAAEHQAFDTVRQVGALVAGTLPPGAVNPEAWRP